MGWWREAPQAIKLCRHQTGLQATKTWLNRTNWPGFMTISFMYENLEEEKKTSRESMNPSTLKRLIGDEARASFHNLKRNPEVSAPVVNLCNVNSTVQDKYNIYINIDTHLSLQTSHLYHRHFHFTLLHSFVPFYHWGTKTGALKGSCSR